MSRFLLEPCNNTLSHIAKCLALRRKLEERGHEAFLAVSSARAGFLDRIGEDRYFILPDIQEANAAPLPGFSWFRPEHFAACVRAEADLLRDLCPDAILGVFRFTGPCSAALAGIPYDSLTCGAMTPACLDTLGFEKKEPGEEKQAQALRFFRTACAKRLAPAFDSLGLPPVDDIWKLLTGRRTFLWDYPEFQPLPPTNGFHHIGPILWTNWPKQDARYDSLATLRAPVAYVAFGTGSVPAGWQEHLVQTLWRMGYSVALALGGQTEAGAEIGKKLPADPQRLAMFEFIPVELALPHADLLVCHGGQGLVFEALRQRIPIFVLPMQPEQSQNGVCLERIGCGKRLLRGTVFGDYATDFDSAFLSRPETELAEEMQSFLGDSGLSARLHLAAAHLARYRGTDSLAEFMETP